MNRKEQGKTMGPSDIVELATSDLDKVTGAGWSGEVIIVVGGGNGQIWVVMKTNGKK
jgi:hypothetical protein